MPLSIMGGVIATVKQLLQPTVTDDGINPIHRAIGTWGFWIQSHIIHIPNRLGLFSPAPPQLQAYEAASISIMLLGVVLSHIVCLGLAILLFKQQGRPVSEAVRFIMAQMFISIVWAVPMHILGLS